MKQKFYWTEEKVDELKNIWNTKSLYKIAADFHTTEETIREKASEIGLEEYKSNRWTKEEEELLREYSKKYVTKTIAKKLGRSYLAVQKKAVKLGIELRSTPDPWKKWMIDYLKDNINKQPIGQIESMIGLSYHSILTKCKELGIEYVKESWTEEEIKILREYADKCHYTELTKVLPNRTIGAITAKAYELGIETISTYTKLDDKQIKYIKDNWGEIPATEIARNLKISVGILNRYKKELNLPNTGQQKKWTEEVISKLRRDAKTKTRNELAKKYKTSPAQISTIARKNNIKLIDSKIVWTDELVSQLEKLIDQGLGISEISKEMDMKAYSIRQQIRKMKGDEFVNPSSRVKRWTDDEVNKLISLSKIYTTEEIAEILNKTERQVYNKAVKIGIQINRNKQKLWTETDTQTLINLHDSYELHLISKVMEKSEAIIREKAKDLGLELKFKERTNWSLAEEQLLREYAKDYTINEIAYLLERTISSVNAKLRYMGIKAVQSSKFWTEEEESKLKRLSDNFSIEEIAEKMNKSYESIIAKLYQLRIRAKNYSNKRWTKEEETELLELLTSYSSFETAEILERSEEAIIVKAISLGYNIDSKHRKWTQEEETLLSDLWGSESIENIAKKLNRTASSITNRVYVLGLGSQIENNYDGLKIQDISDIFHVNRNVILTSWVSLGLKLSFRKRSNHSVYSYVQINDLYEFLETNQNIWDSRSLEKNILGAEPEWLKEKRIRDTSLPTDEFGLENLTKQQLLLAKQYFLDSEYAKENTESNENTISPRLIKTKDNKKR